MLKLLTGNWLFVALLALSGAASFAGWRWLEVRETLAVERSQFETRESQLNARLTQLGEMSLKNFEASNAYQAKLATTNTELDALRRDHIGLQVISRRRIPAVEITAARRSDAAPEVVEIYREVEVDLGALRQIAADGQADAEQLLELQNRIRAQ